MTVSPNKKPALIFYVKQVLLPLLLTLALAALFFSVLMAVDSNSLSESLRIGFAATLGANLIPSIIWISLTTIKHKKLLDNSLKRYRAHNTISCIAVIPWVAIMVLLAFQDSTGWGGIAYTIFGILGISFLIFNIIVETILYFIFRKSDNSDKASDHTKSISN